MVACVQRCSRAVVRIEDRVLGSIARGLLLLVGVEKGDDHVRAEALAERILGLRVFEDENGRMNRPVCDVRGEILVVPQFTLAASLDRGRRPSFDRAAPPEEARALYERVVDRLRASGLRVATGSFGARMAVELVNEGPVTFLLYERSTPTLTG
jgi:D-tyrosyl-tRNA(Tyr) deacylase